MRASSSTMRIAATRSSPGGRLRFRNYGLFRQRQEDHETGSGFSLRRPAIEKFYGAAVLVHDFRHDGEAQAHSAFLGGEEWVENVLAKLGRNSWTRIRHSHLDAPPLASCAQSDRNVQPAATLTHGIVGILYQIHEYLLAKILVHGGVRQIPLKLALDSNLRSAPIGGHRPERSIHDLGNRTGPRFNAKRPREIQKSAYQGAEAVHFRGNISSQLRRQRFRTAEPLVQHFRRTLDDSQRIADFVCQTGGELAQRGKAFGAARFRLSLLQFAVGF